MRLGLGVAVGLLVFLACSAIARTEEDAPHKAGDSDLTLRSDLLRGRRTAKLDSLVPPSKGVPEKVVYYIETGEVVEKLRHGFHGFFLKLGGLSSNARYGFGVRYQRRVLDQDLSVNWSASYSFNKYRRLEAGLEVERLGPVPLGLSLYNRYRNFPEEEYFGLGPASSLSNECDFRLEDYEATVKLAARLAKGLTIGGGVGYTSSWTEEGTDEEAGLVQETFPAGDLAGFLQSIEHQVTGVFARLDYRDSPGNPRSGAYLVGERRFYEDLEAGAYDFESSRAEFQGYLPFFHKHRVIVLRALVESVRGRDGGAAPFHYLPYAGGSETIRGFEEYRFRDRKLILANLEYRFEAFIGLDIALFGDFGQVAGRWERFKSSDFRSSYGAGLRFNTSESVFLRFDVGHGAEGTKFHLKFENVF